MTATLPTLPVSNAPSRRALLAGALGGVGALAASAIGRASPVRATNGDAVLVGFGFIATGTTQISNSTTTSTVFAGYSDSGIGLEASSGSNTALYASSGSGMGVYGSSTSYYGVHGVSDSSYGVLGTSNSNVGTYGTSTSNIGVYGTSSSHIGVSALSYATNEPSSLGYSGGDSTGVQGVSGGVVPAARAKTGVYGYAVQDSSAKGVWGETTSGHGIHGSASTGYAGYFAGKVYTTAFYEMTEISAPAAPGANKARLFARVNASGKTQLCVRFQSGAVQVIKTEP